MATVGYMSKTVSSEINVVERIIDEYKQEIYRAIEEEKNRFEELSQFLAKSQCEAEQIITEAKEKAHTISEEIIAQAEQKAQQIINDAEEVAKNEAKKKTQKEVDEINRTARDEAAKMIKPVLGDIPLILVGGLRKMSEMEEILGNGYADFISICRPFIREPFLVKNFKEGKQDEASCISCNRCLAALPNDFPVHCYVEKFPKAK